MLNEVVTFFAGIATIVSTYYVIKNPNIRFATGRIVQYRGKSSFVKILESFLRQHLLTMIMCSLIFFTSLVIPQIIVPIILVLFYVGVKNFRKSKAKVYYYLSIAAMLFFGLLGSYLSAFDVFPMSILPYKYSKDFEFLDIWFYIRNFS